MSSEQDRAGGAALPRPFQLSRSAAKWIKIAVIGAVVLLTLGGVAQIVLWTMPVDSYTVVEVAPRWLDPALDGKMSPGSVIGSYSSTDAGFATRLRQTINNNPEACDGCVVPGPSVADGPLCEGSYPFPSDHVPPAGTQFTMTFRSGGRVIETVTGYTNDCEFALVKCGLVSVWKADVQPIPLPAD
jgi:hypothetical protein